MIYGYRELRFDKHLEQICRAHEHIMTLGGSKLTAEKILAAILYNCVDKPRELDILETMYRPLTKIMGKDVNLIRITADKLTELIKEDACSTRSILYKTLRMEELLRKEQSLESNVVSVQELLEVLMKTPSDMINEALEFGKRNITGGMSPTEKFKDKSIKELMTLFTRSKTGIAALTYTAQELGIRLKEKVIGQDHAIDVFCSGFFSAFINEFTETDNDKPAATFLFTGPPGVGKTYLAQNAAKLLGLPFARFDMSEFADDESNLSFIGSNKVYKQSAPGFVTEFVKYNPRCVLPFHEIGKALPVISRLFLQMLDAGRLKDTFYDEEISFSEAIIIMTTNAGKNLYQGKEREELSGLSKKVILNALRNDVDPNSGRHFFPPEICSRFASGNVIMFNPLAAYDLRRIVKQEIQTQTKKYTSAFNISIETNSALYSTLLFAEGGKADARTVTARARTFFSEEIFELAKIITSSRVNRQIESLDKIQIRVELPEDNEQISELYEIPKRPSLLLYADSVTREALSGLEAFFDMICVDNIKEAEKALSARDIMMILADPLNQIREAPPADRYLLNIRHVNSLTKDFLTLVHEKYGSTPVYIIECKNILYSDEEISSYSDLGVRAALNFNPLFSDKDREKNILETAEMLLSFCRDIQGQRSINKLASSGKVLSYETGQLMPEDNTAVICLSDLKITTAVDAEDMDKLLSSATRPDITFDDVIGADDAKKELSFFVDYLRNPRRFVGTGLNPPKGVLLYGPPGTGKTMLAKAMAGEADTVFLPVEGNRFLQKYVGEGAKMIHELFAAARKYAPAIIFIDEIDTIGSVRTGNANGNDHSDILTALLTEMDGFDTNTAKPVFVLAATNYSIGEGSLMTIDSALARRFDRRIHIDLPARSDRLAFLEMKVKASPAIRIPRSALENLSVRSVGMSLAELEQVLELSMRTAVRKNKLKVNETILNEAFELYKSGEEKKWDEKMLERIARHEAGHTIISLLSGDRPSYVTITSRADHGGYMQHGDSSGKLLYTRRELLSLIRIALGGRAAEIVYYGEEDGISTGASSDIEQATRLAERMICEYGMSRDHGMAVRRPGANTDDLIYSEINAVLNEQLQEAIHQIKAHTDEVNKLVEELIKKNHLTDRELSEIFSTFR